MHRKFTFCTLCSRSYEHTVISRLSISFHVASVPVLDRSFGQRRGNGFEWKLPLPTSPPHIPQWFGCIIGTSRDLWVYMMCLRAHKTLYIGVHGYCLLCRLPFEGIAYKLDVKNRSSTHKPTVVDVMYLKLSNSTSNTNTVSRSLSP